MKRLFTIQHARQFRAAAVLSALGALLLSPTVVPLAHADIVHVAGAANISGNSAYLLGEDTFSKVLMVTPVWNIGGGPGVYDNHNIGVFWNIWPRGEWAVFNQDMAAMPTGAEFNVWSGAPGGGVFSYYATASGPLGPGNITNNWAYMDNPLTNGNPNALVFVTPNWSPRGIAGIYDNHPLGVWYDRRVGKWAVFNQDMAAMPVGAAFNVVVQPPSAVCYTHRATAGNTVSSWTYLDNVFTNGHSNSYVFVTANWNPGGWSGVYNNHPLGVWFDSVRQKWAVFNQDMAAMPVGAAFNVWIIPENGDLASLKLNNNLLVCPINSTWANVTLDFPAPEGGAVIQLSSSNTAFWPADSAGHPISTITIPAGSQTGSFWVYTNATWPVSATITASYRGISKQATVTEYCP